MRLKVEDAAFTTTNDEACLENISRQAFLIPRERFFCPSRGINFFLVRNKKRLLNPTLGVQPP